MATKKDGDPLFRKGTIFNPKKTVEYKKSSIAGVDRKEKYTTKEYNNLIGNPVQKNKKKTVETSTRGKLKDKTSVTTRSFKNPITGIKTDKTVVKQKGMRRSVIKNKSN